MQWQKPSHLIVAAPNGQRAKKERLYPARCDSVLAVIDTASKTGMDHGATAVTFYSYNPLPKVASLLILDWDIVQVEGAMPETWLPSVFDSR